MKHAVITGANGFVGFAVLKELLSNDYQIYAIIRPVSCTSFINKIKASCLDERRITIIPYDLHDIDRIKECLLSINTHFDAFYHLAWNGSAGTKRSDLKVQLDNIQLTGNILDMLAKLDVGCFVGAGSIMEDEALNMAYKGLGKTNPNYIYSSAKLESHLVSKIKAQSYGIDIRWAKITNAFGEGDNTGRFINTMIRKMMKDEECCFSKGDQLYDFIYITDAARAFRLIGEKGCNLSAYNLGSGKADQLKSFIYKMRDTIKSESVLKFNPDNTGICYLDESSFSIDSLNHDTGFEPEVKFEDGIVKAIAYLKQQ